MKTAKYPISDTDMVALFAKYPFLKYRKLYGDGSDVYPTVAENVENNYYKIWDGSGWEDLWKHRYLPRLFAQYDSWPEQQQKEFYFTDVKEKYGGLRIYTSFSTDGDISSIAEWISEYTCQYCGAEPRTSTGCRQIWTTGGWITNLCRNCAREYLLNGSPELTEEQVQEGLFKMNDVLEGQFGYKRFGQGGIKLVTFRETADGWLEKDSETLLDPEEEKKKFIEGLKGE